ncbi:D-alanyl-D-alanine carboxypeptidase/D-alanyl-D-alanine-endopeptidase [Sporosarcina sp. FSL K6-1522]|uniref:D-alanyl-D-alanine carboxypeptidase/D-alanyl-D-alanine endopeptidase n=1 Tax=Sporosarcina sp. FSL K6-1522 TaxID=2921554 RepID=UPI00315B13F0
MCNKNYVKKAALFFLIAALFFLPVQIGGQSLFAVATNDTKQGVAIEAATLDEKIDRILENPLLKGSITGVSIRHADTAEVLYSQFGDIRLHPASNMKLLTTAAALETLGEDYQFTTEVLTDGELRGKVLQGNVYLKGKGDPTLLKEDFDQFAKDLKAKGIHKIKGNLIGDDSWYDDVRLSQDLNWSDESFYTGAQVSALTVSPNEDYDTGTVIVEVNPGSEIGENAKVTLSPETDYVKIINKTVTTAKNEPKKISIEREHGTNNILIEGTIPLEGVRSRSWVAVWEPTGYVVDIFQKSLIENGVTFAGNPKMQVGVTPGGATVLTSKKSMELKEILVPFMKLSNNGLGEVLTKEMGKVVHGEGSWDKGLEVIKKVVTDLGVDGNTIMLRDGSGMSHKNFIPADDLSQMLFAAQRKSWFPTFENSLPVAGEADRFVGGTLRSRMTAPSTKGNVKAKTGSLTGVSSLSGYVTSKDGERLIFSIMINNVLGGSVTSIEDEIATVLAEHEIE